MISLRLAPRQQQQPSWEAAAAVDDMIFDAARHGDERAMIHALIKLTGDELAYTRGEAAAWSDAARLVRKTAFYLRGVDSLESPAGVGRTFSTPLQPLPAARTARSPPIVFFDLILDKNRQLTPVCRKSRAHMHAIT